jgi:hypothetical protein
MQERKIPNIQSYSRSIKVGTIKISFHSFPCFRTFCVWKNFVFQNFVYISFLSARSRKFCSGKEGKEILVVPRPSPVAMRERDTAHWPCADHCARIECPDSASCMNAGSAAVCVCDLGFDYKAAQAACEGMPRFIGEWGLGGVRLARRTSPQLRRPLP